MGTVDEWLKNTVTNTKYLITLYSKYVIVCFHYGYLLHIEIFTIPEKQYCDMS